MPKQKFRIAFFTDTYTPQINGVVSSIESFRMQLEKLGHEVTIFAPKLGLPDVRDKSVIRFPSLKFVFQPEYHVSLPISARLLKDYWNMKFDIVHAHTPFSLGNLALVFSRMKRIPLVYTYHTLYPEYVKAYILKGKVIRPKLVAKTNAFYSNRCDLNIRPSVKIQKKLKSYGVTQPIEVLPTGIKLQSFNNPRTNDFRSRYKINKNDYCLIFVGRLGPEKNISFIVKAFNLLAHQHHNFKLVIVGDGPDKVNLLKLVHKYKINNQVIFTGYLNQPEVNKAYHASNVFVFASTTDTQGMVILESAATGLPLVAVKDEAFTNMLRTTENGFTTGKSINAFAQKIELLYKDKKLYSKMAEKSKLIAKEYSIEKQTTKLLHFYKKYS